MPVDRQALFVYNKIIKSNQRTVHFAHSGNSATLLKVMKKCGRVVYRVLSLPKKEGLHGKTEYRNEELSQR